MSNYDWQNEEGYHGTGLAFVRRLNWFIDETMRIIKQYNAPLIDIPGHLLQTMLDTGDPSWLESYLASSEEETK